jgi:hypothetical protein
MNSSPNAMETFFRNHERNSNRSSIGPLIAQYADVFMVGGPQGAQVVQASAFALALPNEKSCSTIWAADPPSLWLCAKLQ